VRGLQKDQNEKQSESGVSKKIRMRNRAGAEFEQDQNGKQSVERDFGILAFLSFSLSFSLLPNLPQKTE
jgi:hypothetical protein